MTKPNLLATIFFLIFVGFFGTELALYYSMRTPEVEKSHTPSIFVDDEDLYYRLTPNSQINATATYQGQPVYNVTYTIDEFGRRQTANNDKANKFAIFFGGSHAMGAGLNDNETLPYFFSQKMPNYQVYNYAVNGYGPNHMLAILESGRLTDEIKPDSGVGFYLYNSFHVRRALGSVEYFRRRNSDQPYYMLLGDGEVVRNKGVKSARLLQTLFYRTLAASNIAQWLQIELPKPFSKKVSELNCGIIRRSQSIFHQLYPKSDFVVVLGVFTGANDPIIETCLTPYQIKFLKIKRIPPNQLASSVIMPEVDKHPNKEANQNYADQLVQWYQTIAPK